MPNRPDYAAGTYGGFAYAGDWVTDLASASDGVSGASAGLSVAHPLAGTSAGAATVAADVRVAHPLAGSSAGVSTLGGESINYKNLAGTTAGTSGVGTPALVVAHTLVGGSDGLSGASAAVLVAHPLVGSSAGNAALSVALAVSHPLAARSDGASTVSATVTPLRNLAGESDSTSTVAADLTDTAPDYVLVPRLDVAINSWTTDTGATTGLIAAIDELTASDADYIQSPVGPSTAQYYEAALETRPDPLSSTGHIAHYRYQKTGTGTMDLTVALYQGTTQIASWAHTNIGTTWVQQDQTLSAAVADSITNYDDLRFRFTPSQVASENLAPDALLLQTNLVGAVTAIDDDPDAPGTDWLTATSTTAASILRVSFPTPTLTPAAGAGLQQFRVWVRKTSGSGTPTTTIELWESGVLKSTPLAATNITSTTGQLLTATWDASTLTTATGANVELRLTGTVGGSGANRATMEVGAVEWVVGYPTGRAQVSWANFELPVGGVTWTLTGQSDGTSTAGADLAVAHPLAGESDGAATASATVIYVAVLAGTTTGTSSAAADLTVAHPLAGASTGASAATGALTVAHPLAGAANSTSSVAADVRVAHPLAAVSTGTSTVSATAIAAWVLAGRSDGTSTDTTAVLVGHLLNGRSDGVSTIVGDVVVAHALAGSTGATSTASGTLSNNNLSGVIAGTSSAAADLAVAHPLAGQSDDVSTATAAVAVAHSLAGQTGAGATAAATLSATLSLAGSPAGVATASATANAAWRLAGQSDGTSTDTVAVLVGHLLAGRSDGLSTATGDAVVAHPLAAASAGTSTTTASLTTAHPLAGSSAGTSSVGSADLVVAHPMVGSSAGTSTASGSALAQYVMAAASAGASTASGTALVAHTMQAVSAGVSGLIGETAVAWMLAGRSDGSSTDIVAVLVGHLLDGQSNGLSTVAGEVLVAHPLAGDAAGLSGASAGLTVAHPLDASSAGASGASAMLAPLRPLAGASAATSGATGDLAVAHPLAAIATGTSTVSGAASAAHPLAGAAADVSGASGAVVVTWALAGQSDGTATDTVAVLVGYLLNGRSDGMSSIVGDVVVDHPLEGSAAGTSSAQVFTLADIFGATGGQSSATADLAVSRGLAGATGGVTGAEGATAVAISLSGATAPGTVVFQWGVSTFEGGHAFEGQLDEIRATLSVGWTLSGSTGAVSTASAMPLAYTGLTGATAGSSSASGTIRAISNIAGTTGGTSGLSGTFAIDLSGRSDSASTAAAALEVHILSGRTGAVSTVTGELEPIDHPIAGSSAGRSTASATLLLPRPPNDNFANAEVLATLGTSGGSSSLVLANTTGARTEVGEPAPYAGVGGKSVWYRWTPEVAGTATIDTIGSAFDTTVDVFIGSTLATLTTVVGDHDSGPGGSSFVSFAVEPGRTYRIRVDSFDGGVGSLTLHWALALPVLPPPPPPANDDFANAIDIGKTLVGSMSGTTAGATSIAAEPLGEGSATVWYKWTAPDYGFMRITPVQGYGTNSFGETILPLHGPYLSMGSVLGEPTSVATLYEVDEMTEKLPADYYAQPYAHVPEWTEWWAVKGVTYWFGFHDAWVDPPGHYATGEFTFGWEFRKQRMGPDLPDGGWIAMGYTYLNIDDTAITNPVASATRGWMPANLFSSKDGVNWEVAFTPFDNDWTSYEFMLTEGSTILYGGWPFWTEFEATLALGLVYSQDGGVTWKAANTPMLGSGQNGWRGSDFYGEYDTWARFGLKGNGRFVVGGYVDDNGTDYRGNDSKAVIVSAPTSDPATWTVADLPFLDTANSGISHMAFLGDRFFAEVSTVQASVTTYTYMSSADGVTWTILPYPAWQQNQYAYHYFFQAVYDVNGTWIAYSSRNDGDFKMVSTDKGVTWSAPAPTPSIPYAYFTDEIAYNGSRWVAVVITQTAGSGTFVGDKQVAWSDDFETWNPVTTPFSVDALGQPTSAQTVAWQSGFAFRNYTGTFAESVSWDGEFFWAAGGNGGLYSGATWPNDHSPTVTLARSADGVNWTQIHTPVEQGPTLQERGEIVQVKKLASALVPVVQPPALVAGTSAVGVRR